MQDTIFIGKEVETGDPVGIDLEYLIDQKVQILGNSRSGKRKKLKTKALELLGNKCQCKDPNCWCKGKCEINDIRLLQIDHINGGGTKENYHSTQRHYRIISNENGYRKTVQILCANCNWIKGNPSPLATP